MLYRVSHLLTVRGQTPTANAAAFGVCPLSTWRTIRSQPFGVSRAFLWMSIRSSGESLKLRNLSFLRPGPSGQPIESSQLRGAGDRVADIADESVDQRLVVRFAHHPDHRLGARRADQKAAV